MGPPTVDIFFSHSNADATLADALLDTLNTALPTAQIRSSRRVPSSDKLTWREEVPREVAGCGKHIALFTIRSLQSPYFLHELGARMGAGKETLSIVAPNVGMNVLPKGIQVTQVCDLSGGTAGSDWREDTIEALLGWIGPLSKPKDYYDLEDRVKSVVAIAEEYRQTVPTPLPFDRMNEPNYLSADQIIASAESFLDNKIPTRDGFVPDVVLGVNSGGTCAAGVFSERRPDIHIGTIWIGRPDSPPRHQLPDLEARRVLLVDSKLRCGESIARAAGVAFKEYGNKIDLRLLVTLVYNGWISRPSEAPMVDFPNKHFWPARITVKHAGQEIKLWLYASYFTETVGALDEIGEPGQPEGGRRHV